MIDVDTEKSRYYGKIIRVILRNLSSAAYYLSRSDSCRSFPPKRSVLIKPVPRTSILGQTFTLYLVQRFAGGDLLAHDLGCFLQHAVVGLQIVDCRDRTMSGDQFCPSGIFVMISPMFLVNPSTSRRFQIHKRKSTRKEVVAKVNHV